MQMGKGESPVPENPCKPSRPQHFILVQWVWKGNANIGCNSLGFLPSEENSLSPPSSRSHTPINEAQSELFELLVNNREENKDSAMSGSLTPMPTSTSQDSNQSNAKDCLRPTRAPKPASLTPTTAEPVLDQLFTSLFNDDDWLREVGNEIATQPSYCTVDVSAEASNRRKRKLSCTTSIHPLQMSQRKRPQMQLKQQSCEGGLMHNSIQSLPCKDWSGFSDIFQEAMCGFVTACSLASPFSPAF